MCASEGTSYLPHTSPPTTIIYLFFLNYNFDVLISLFLIVVRATATTGTLSHTLITFATQDVSAPAVITMRKRKCPQNKKQDGVCGCPSFWRRSKANPLSNVKDLSTPSTKLPPDTIVIGSELEDDGDLHQRKRQKREHNVFRQDGEVGPARSKLSTYTNSKVLIAKHPGHKQDIAKMNTRAQEKAAVKEKAKVNMPVRILVDYVLPTGAERLDWDTDEVRRMAGEIEGEGYKA
ncbi:hypothetical protein IG631_17599 [Alternaria alternata]|nr:hypothetical protein IG631_17599 [Alternaria alternata]